MLPEPFSITLAVFAVIGFVNLARQGAQAVHKNTKGYKTAPEDLHDIFTDTQLADFQLREWRRIWSIEDHTRQDYVQCLWEDGWTHIKDKIDKIERISCEIENILRPLIKDYMTEGPGKGLPAINSAKDLRAANLRAAQSEYKAMRESDEKRIRAELWWRSRIHFVLSKSEELKELLGRISVTFEALDKLCVTAYFAAHDQPLNISYRERRDTAIIQMITSQVITTRETSRTVHEFCRSTVEGDMELELSLLQWRLREHSSNGSQPLVAGLPEQLRYYLTISPSMLPSTLENDRNSDGAQSSLPQQLEILIEKKVRSLGQCKTNFRDVCKEISNNKNCFFQSSVLEPATNTTPSVFWVSKPSDPVSGSGRNEYKLSTFLTRSADNASGDDLSLRERVELAYRLAECCLLLLKTSWLSNFESRGITRAHCAGKTSRYRLFIGPQSHEMDVYESPQILRLGRLLRELALGIGVGVRYASRAQV